eukprot:TRINITY_DN1188_c2_g1_i1.p2 TRINITY_DN1188_c2_g1~~TRINITY_DN1188_c2_g1_i1.p2  ORF type:complete len:496 (-),score=80.67 TRINITY_DN1188_c2_g1_i1:308-1795(-)
MNSLLFSKWAICGVSAGALSVLSYNTIFAPTVIPAEVSCEPLAGSAAEKPKSFADWFWSSSSGAEKYKYVVLGGGNASGYAARQFLQNGVSPGEVCILTNEPYVAYERPALSKAYLFPEKAARLPGFHTTVGGGGERQTPDWYKEKGIEYKVNTNIVKVDVNAKKLIAEDGKEFEYDKLIIATGCRPLTLQDFKMKGADHELLYYLRDVVDADKMIEGIKKAKSGPKGGKVVALGGGYIGMETAAVLQMNGLKVAMVFPEPHLMPRLFTQKIADFYTKYYNDKGIAVFNGKLASSIESAAGNGVAAVLKSGEKMEADMVVVGVGAKPNNQLFVDQLEIDPKNGGIKVDAMMKTSNPDVYAVGDIASFPLKIEGNKYVRQEHVTHCRSSAYQAVNAIMKPGETKEYDYLPFFYSRVYDLSWKFYGISEGDVVHFGDYKKPPFGAYWIRDGKIVGAFMEGPDAKMSEAMAKITRERPDAPAAKVLEKQGINYAINRL